MARIAFDARWIHSSNLDGAGGYALNLLINLLKIDPTNQYLILFDRPDRRQFIERQLAQAGILAGRYEVLSIFDETHVFKNCFLLPRILSDHLVDIFFSPSYIVPPFFKSYRLIVMVPDLEPVFAPIKLARACWFLNLVYRFKFFIKIMFDRCDKIIALSPEIARDLNRLFQVDPSKTSVVLPGIDAAYFEASTDAARASAKKVYRLPEKYILSLGKIGEGNNPELLLQSYAALPEDLRERYPLVIGGVGQSSYAGQIEKIAQNLGIAKSVLFLGYIAREHQIAILQMAQVFVSMSNYEGFPQLIFQAMASRVTAVASKVFFEICHQAILPVDLVSPAQITQSIQEALVNLETRNRLCARGFEAARALNWEKTANSILALYT